MYNIDEVMDMLDCNNDVEIQEKGIELAKNVNNRRICSASEVKKLLERYKQENKITPIQVKDKLRTSLKW